jgi:RNA polymerase sigma-70 factor (ECF subfamily)
MDRTDVAHNQHRTVPAVTVAGGETDEYLAGLAASDPAAFAELYRRYVARIHRYCSRRLRDQGLAEDATSQVFLKALESLRRKRIDNVASWLFAIAHNEVVDRYRRHHPDTPYDQQQDLASTDRSPEELAIAASASSDLRRLLPYLSADQQRVIELRLAGLSTQEIQDVLGRSRSWVGTTQHRALHRLRELMHAPRAGEGQP